MERGERVAHGEIWAHRRPVGKTGDVAHAAHRLADGGEAGPLAVRAALAVARDAPEGQPRALARERLPAEGPPLPRPGAEVLDHDVAVAREAARDRLPFGLAQVERDRFLVARLHVPP